MSNASRRPDTHSDPLQRDVLHAGPVAASGDDTAACRAPEKDSPTASFRGGQLVERSDGVPGGIDNASLPVMLGNYELLEVIGRGGMGSSAGRGRSR